MQELATTTSELRNSNAINILTQEYSLAEKISKSKTIPAHYQNNAADVFIAMQTAKRLNIDCFSVMQGTYVVHGKLGMLSTFAITLANTSGLLNDNIQWDVTGIGDAMEVTAHAPLKNGRIIKATVTMEQAIAENWGSLKNSDGVRNEKSKYKTMPQTMLMYRSAIALLRLHLPQVLFGFHSVEELKDVDNTLKQVVETAKPSKIASLKDKLNLLVNEELTEAAVEDEITPSKESEELVISPLEILEEMIASYKVDSSEIDKWLNKAKVKTLAELNDEQIMKSIDFITKNKEAK